MCEYTNPSEEGIPHYQKNGFTIVMNNTDLENEGDVIVTASNITTKQMSFLIRHSNRYICVPMSNEYADILDLLFNK